MDDLAGPEASDFDEAVATDEESQLLSLKDGDTFLVADSWGDVRGGADGLFSGDTRILSRFRLLIGERRPSRLSFGLSRDNASFAMNGANRALPPVGGNATPRGVIHLERKRCLRHGRLFERVRLTNFGLQEVMAPIAYEFEADFRDMFEVRGLRRPLRGSLQAPAPTGRGMLLSYDGLDGRRRTSVVAFSQPPWRIHAGRADFMFTIMPDERIDLFVEVAPTEEDPPDGLRFDAALAGARRSVASFRDRGAKVAASDSAFATWLEVPAGCRGAHHRVGDRRLPLRGHSVVLDAVRPGRNHHRLADAVAGSIPGPGRPRIPRLASGHPRIFFR